MTAAPASGQPVRQIVADILADHRDREGALLPILHAVQEALGHVPEAALRQVAESLGIGRAEAHGTMSFYHDFRTEPAGRTALKLCRAEACQAVGADSLADRARERLGIGWRETTPDGAVTLEPVFCLGLCACGPAAMVGERLVGRLDATKLDRILEEAGA